MKITRKSGTTSEILQVFIRDSSSTTGAGLTGLAFNSASLVAYYCRNDQGTATAISLVTMTLGTFTSSGFKEIDATNMPGWYQFCPPNAVFTSGRSAALHLKGATNMAPLPIEVEITAVDNQDSVRFGLTALPNAAAGANTGLPVVGTQVPNATAGAANGLTIAGSNAATTFATLTSTGAFSVNGVSNISQTGDNFARLGAPAGASVSVDIAAVSAKTTNLPPDPADASDILALFNALNTLLSTTGIVLTAAERTALAGVIGTTAQTESYRANAATGSIAQLLYEILGNLVEANNSGTTRTVKKIDHSTTAATYTYDAATPNTITRAT